ncbi:MAG: hypothetical protein ACOYOP_08885 [Microthrixaceae bacterium]
MGCGCLIVLASALSPRLGLFLMWLFTDKVPQSYDGNWIVAILGFFFLPWTTLAWALVWAPIGGVKGVGWFLVILAFLADLSTHAAAARSRREQRAAA